MVHLFRYSIVFVGIAGFFANAQVETEAKRNIVFVLIDDQRYDALSITGHPYLETPKIDDLARNGLLCENAFVTTSLCSPSRASILTGQYAHVHGVMDNGTLLNPDTPTFPQELQKAGYTTGFIGKWHMGGSSDEPRPGWHRWVSFRGQGVYNDPTFNIDGERSKHEGYVTDLITDYAVDFVHENAERPFMLYMSHKAVHAPFTPAERHEGSYDDVTYRPPSTYADTDENYEGKPRWVRNQRPSWHGVDGYGLGDWDLQTFTREYAEAMRAVDDSVGRLKEALREEGLLESTFFVYTSDNGFLFGEHGLVDKRTMHEPSIRVPLIVHCPELIKPGRTDEILTNIDFAPTFLDIAGVPVPGSMQGESFFELVQGEDVEWRDAFLYEYFWERSFPQTPTVLGVRTKTHKFMRYHGVYDRYELYNLEEDPEETNNILGDYLQGNEPGTLDNLITRQAPKEVEDQFLSMRRQLFELLDQYGALREPIWSAHGRP